MLAREVDRDGIATNIVRPVCVATNRIYFLGKAKARREGQPVAEVTAENTGATALVSCLMNAFTLL